jgi:hypothetical protein
MQIESLSLVLADGPSDQAVADAIVALVDQWRTDGVVFALRERIEGDGVTTFVWEDIHATRTELRLTFDVYAAARYVSAASPSKEARNALFDRLAGAITAVDLDDLMVAADSLDPRDPGAILRLALGLNRHYVPRAHAILRKALSHPDVEVRASAVEAAGLLQWRVLAEDLDAAIGRETDHGIAHMLAGVRANLSDGE